MECYQDERRIQELRRCGCKKCHREYDELMYRYRYRQNSYYDAPPMINKEPKTPKVETIEPKDIAVKLILDRFKAEQGKLAVAEASIRSFKATLATQNKTKSDAQKVLKELGAALKKLGHKEETNNA